MTNLPLEALYFFIFSSVVVANYTRALIYRCLKSLKRRSSIVLLLHIATSTVEVLRYYARLALSLNPKGFQSNIIDITLAIL